MKKTLSFILLAASAILIIFWYRSTSDRRPLGDTLIVGTSADFPPFSFRASDDSITGFDIDVIKEIARRLSMGIELQDKQFSTLLPQLELGQIHAIAAGMTPTKERAERVTFTKPYLSGNPLLIVSRQSDPKITGLSDLKGKNVLVNTGYTADLYMSSLQDSLLPDTTTLLRLPKVTDALTALEQGKADAFVTASFTLMPYVKEGDTRFNYFPLTETDEQSAIAFSKELPAAFIERAQQALDDMEADGSLDALKKKWHVL